MAKRWPEKLAKEPPSLLLLPSGGLSIYEPEKHPGSREYVLIMKYDETTIYSDYNGLHV